MSRKCIINSILFSLILWLLLFVGVSHSATYTVCASGCDYSTIAAVNAVDFADGDIVQFTRGETFTDATLTLAGITNPSTKTITIEDTGAGDLPKLGYNTREAINISHTNISLVIKNLNVDGQEFAGDYQGSAKIYITLPDNVTLDNIEADGSVGYDTDCTPDVDCKYHRGIWVNYPNDLEVKNCTIENWGGDEDLWVIPKPAYTDMDASCLSVTILKGTGSISIHDNTIQNCESDCIIMEDIQSTGSHTIYDNTLWNGGENSLDIKGSKNISVYGNTMGRDAAFVGIGGSSTSPAETEQPVMQVITRPNYSSGNISIHDNTIGPTDLSNLRIKRVDEGYEVVGVDVYQNDFKQAKFQVILGHGADEIKLHDNTFDGIAANGFFFWSYYGTLTPSTPPKIYNNTWYSNSDTGLPVEYGGVQHASLVKIYDDNEGGCSDGLWKNNIFHINDDNAPAGTGNYIMYIEGSCNPTLDHNLFYNAYAGNDEIILDNATPYGEDDQATWISAGHTGAVFDNPDLNDPGNDDFTLQLGSPAIDTGTFHTTITTATGSGTTLTVADADYFKVDDDIKTENGQTGTVSSVNYGTDQIILDASISWVQNEGIAPDYVGTAPDMGSEEYSSPPAGNGIEDPTPPNGVSGQSVDVDISWTKGDDVTDTDIYFDDTDCTTNVNDDGDAETSYDPGTLENSTTYYWKVVTEPDGANLSFPSTGCYEFTTVGSTPDLGGFVYGSGYSTGAYNPGGATWGYVAP